MLMEDHLEKLAKMYHKAPINLLMNATLKVLPSSDHKNEGEITIRAISWIYLFQNARWCSFFASQSIVSDDSNYNVHLMRPIFEDELASWEAYGIGAFAKSRIKIEMLRVFNFYFIIIKKLEQILHIHICITIFIFWVSILSKMIEWFHPTNNQLSNQSFSERLYGGGNFNIFNGWILLTRLLL